MFGHQRAIPSLSLPSLADRLVMFNGIVDAMEGAGMEVPSGLTADQLVTNEFIDESIGF